LRETPCMKFDNVGTTIDAASLQSVFSAFGDMEEHQKEEYLSLANKFLVNEELWPPYSIGLRAHVRQEIERMDLNDMDVETAENIFHIYGTNSFHNGIFIKMSRFNHSCIPNAEYFWNEDTETRDLRACRNIREGEQITISYLGVEMMDRDERRHHLIVGYHFLCCCAACDISDEEMEIQRQKVEKFKELGQERKSLNRTQYNPDLIGHIKREVECLKEMYKLAKELKIQKLRIIVDGILQVGFDACCQLYCQVGLTSQNRQERAQLLKEVNNFADVGLALSILLHGEEYSACLEWEKRKKNPIEYFLKSSIPSDMSERPNGK